MNLTQNIAAIPTSKNAAPNGLAVLIVMLTTLWIDLSLPLGVAGGVPYVLAVLISTRLKNQSVVILVAILSSVLTVVGYQFSSGGLSADHIVIINRAMALGVIWCTAILANRNTKKRVLLEQSKKNLDQKVATQTQSLNEAIAELEAQSEKLIESERKVVSFNKKLEKEVKQRTKAYEQASKLYKDLYHNSPDMYASVSTKTKHVVECNETFLKTLGYKREEIIGQEYYKIYHPDSTEKRKEALDTFLTHGNVKNAELELMHKSGEKIHALLNVTALRDEHGEIIESRSCWQDITERKKIEKQVQELNEELEMRIENLDMVNKELESFSYSVSHDLRSPLRTIHGFCQALEEDYSAELPDQAKNYLNRVTAASIRMGQLIDDILALSRITRKEFVLGVVDISSLADEVGHDIADQSNREVTLKIQPGMKSDGDLGLLRIVFENLIGNAVKYARKDVPAIIEVGMQSDNDLGTMIYVKDNGVGFDMQYADKLFSAFQRLHSDKEFEGTGIGLATVNRIINRHNGKIWAESKVDHGSTFYFTLNT
ncbi:MAG: ATP-binding protein [Fulvivirga sp.]